VEVREASLSDFYARIIVNPNGRINLQDLVKTQEAAPGAVVGAAVAPAPAASAVAQTSAGPVPVIKVGPVSLVNGKVLFSDRFIQPNYSADLSDLTGKLSRFSSVATDGVVQLADLELRGRAEGTASLDITGKLNPLAKPLALDIAGKVRDLELPPLSPYAVKYAGYGIERGKMSLDVRYAVQPDGQLTASNKLVLNQLTFGDKVEGAPNSLPVKLAVALLADRNGVIDLDLPISGSLNDPQFRLGPVIWKVITNLVTKALTAPFSLLANAFGGGDTSELSAVGYASGSAVLTDTARAGLDKVAKALADRPALRMTVVGTANLEAEREALKREKLAGLLLAEKRRVAATKGQDAATVTGFTAEEMPVLLRAVYRRADITKPRNLVGLTKDIAVPDMEALLLANITVNEDAIRDLALQRGVAVKDYLAGKKVSSERLFLGAIKASGPAADAKPQAELNLAGQ
jgi:outer membrane protein OmpA-like peptidoglycan-associated protein